MKYIVKDYLNIYLFGRHISHAEFSEQMQGHCTSAGFVNLTTMVCYGESEGMGIASSPADTRLLRTLSPTIRLLTTELQIIREEITSALQALPHPPPPPLQAADRRLAGLIAGGGV